MQKFLPKKKSFNVHIFLGKVKILSICYAKLSIHFFPPLHWNAKWKVSCQKTKPEQKYTSKENCLKVQF
jgi:hypothetical protein